MIYGTWQQQVRAYRGQIPSPGHPTIAWREDRVKCGAAITTGVLTDEASEAAGIGEVGDPGLVGGVGAEVPVEPVTSPRAVLGAA